MNILIVSATDFEASPILKKLEKLQSEHTFAFEQTGVGILSTAFNLGSILNTKKVDLAINIGLAGSFDKSVKLGEVVEVVFDQLSEEGAEDDEHFLSVYDLGLKSVEEQDLFRATFSVKNTPFKKVEGITVNTVHGSEKSIQKVVKRLNPQVESMEGAAFFYCCNRMSVPCMQVRSISNYVEKRNREAWEIELALDNLAESMLSILKQI